MNGDAVLFKVAIAHRVLSWVADLPRRERLVGNWLLAHLNFTSGRCDPSSRSATRELKITKDTFFEALDGLTKRGFFKRISHGGRSGRNAYVVNFDLCVEMNKNRSMATPSRLAEDANLSLREDMPLSLRKDTNEHDSNDDSSPETQTQKQCRQDGTKQARGNEPRHPHLTHLLPGGRSASHKEAADGAKQRRQAKAINRLPDVRQREAAWLVAMSEADDRGNARPYDPVAEEMRHSADDIVEESGAAPSLPNSMIPAPSR